MTQAAGRMEPEGDRPSELEQLADELGRRDMRTTLAAGDDGPVLEVINPRLTSFGGTPSRVRVWHRAGLFWWERTDEAQSAPDLSRAVEGIAFALRWSPLDPSAVSAVAPDDT
jgi:hypothetical protein